MPTLALDRGAERMLNKLQKKHHNTLERFKLTKQTFDANHRDTKLDFKKHKSISGVFKIRLLGNNDGRRLMLRPDSANSIYYVYDVVEHDDF